MIELYVLYVYFLYRAVCVKVKITKRTSHLDFITDMSCMADNLDATAVAKKSWSPTANQKSFVTSAKQGVMFSIGVILSVCLSVNSIS